MARCRASRSSPFFGEVGINPLAEPGLVAAPAQPFGDEDLADATTLHADGLVLGQIRRQPIERPGGKGQVERLGVGERDRDDGGPLVGCVGRWSARARLVIEARQPTGVEAQHALAHRIEIDVQPGRNRRARLAGMHGLDDACPLDAPRRGCARLRQLLDRCQLVRRQLTQSNRSHRTPPTSRDVPHHTPANLPDEPLSRPKRPCHEA